MAPRNEKLNKAQDHNSKLAAKAKEPFKKSNKGGGSVLSRGDGSTGRSPKFANGITLQDQVDEFYFSALIDEDQLLPISDEKYADELDLQEVLVNCSDFSTKNANIVSSSTTAIKKEQCSSSSSLRTIKIKTEPSFCKICMETSPPSRMFMNKNCLHTFCNDCLRRYISTKIKENISAIKCPEENCRGIIEPENCQGIVPKEVFERWGNALCEAMILGTNKYSYCPFKDCSALLLNDDNDTVTQSECPSCRRLFCARCEVVWHVGLSCEEVKALGVKDREAEDFRLIETVKSATSTTAIKKEQCSSSSSSTIKVKTEPSFCKICMETSRPSHMFMNKNCLHTFCNDCLRRYISTKIKENISAIKCPEENCRGIIEPENCQGIVPKEVFERWGNALCEAMILGTDKYSYCPFKDCSALLLNDDDDNVTQSECPSCRRLFCARCEVVWHVGLSCEEVKALGVKDREAEDFRLIETAKSNKWMKCPQCKFYVEKVQGCLHITCRCRYEFCYRCGQKWSDTHAC